MPTLQSFCILIKGRGIVMSPKENARLVIDRKLTEAG